MSKIVIPKAVYDKVMHWVNKSNNEVGGFGTVKYDKETQSFTVIEAYLLKQEVGMAHTDLDAASVGKLMFETRNDEGDLKWWWHSHVRMSVFWSGTDTDTIKSLGAQEWAVATVFNQMEEMKSALCYKAPSAFDPDNLVLEDDIDTEIEWPEMVYSEDVLAQWDASFDLNVRKREYTPPTYLGGAPYGGGYGKPDSGGYGGDYDWYDDPAWNKTRTAMHTRGHSRGGYMTALAEDDDDDDIDEVSIIGESSHDPGMFGYGIEAEAKILGMKPRKYRALLNKESIPHAKLMMMEDKLELAIKSGRLK